MVNAKGGVNGQKIELIALDDKFDPKLAAENARKLIEENNAGAVPEPGQPPHRSHHPAAGQAWRAAGGPSTGAMVLHQPVRKHVFNVRATYQREAERP